MSRIPNAFTEKNAFIAFITAGDPDLKTTEQLILEMEKAGADLIELGIPFSDPVAEGLVIQKADERALAAGTTTDQIFEMVCDVRKQSQIPLVFLTYINPIFVYGTERFIKRCRECGIDGLIVPDLPYEEREELLPFCTKYQVDLVPLIAPTSEERIRMIAKQAQGFLYCVSSMGVTGVRQNITTDIGGMISLVREVSEIPCAIGFGVSTKKQARQMISQADGVIVGSAIVKLIGQYGKDAAGPVAAYVREMKQAILEEKSSLARI